MTTLDDFTLGTFKPLIGSAFAIGDEPAGADNALMLVEASSLGTAAVGVRESFSLIFLRRSNAVLADDTYRLTHSSLGSFPLFIVPVAQDHDGVRYEAIFN